MAFIDLPHGNKALTLSNTALLKVKANGRRKFGLVWQLQSGTRTRIGRKLYRNGDSYLNKILDVGFDGVYLNVIDVSHLSVENFKHTGSTVGNS